MSETHARIDAKAHLLLGNDFIRANLLMAKTDILLEKVEDRIESSTSGSMSIDQLRKIVSQLQQTITALETVNTNHAKSLRSNEAQHRKWREALVHAFGTFEAVEANFQT